MTATVRPLRTRFDGGSCVEPWARDKRLNLVGWARQRDGDAVPDLIVARNSMQYNVPAGRSENQVSSRLVATNINGAPERFHAGTSLRSTRSTHRPVTSKRSGIKKGVSLCTDCLWSVLDWHCPSASRVRVSAMTPIKNSTLLQPRPRHQQEPTAFFCKHQNRKFSHGRLLSRTTKIELQSQHTAMSCSCVLERSSFARTSCDCPQRCRSRISSFRN